MYIFPVEGTIASGRIISHYTLIQVGELGQRYTGVKSIPAA